MKTDRGSVDLFDWLVLGGRTFLRAAFVADSVQGKIHKFTNNRAPGTGLCTGRTGLYAPRLPTIRPQDADGRRQIRPEFAEETTVSRDQARAGTARPLECRTGGQ